MFDIYHNEPMRCRIVSILTIVKQCNDIIRLAIPLMRLTQHLSILKSGQASPKTEPERPSAMFRHSCTTFAVCCRRSVTVIKQSNGVIVIIGTFIVIYHICSINIYASL